MPITATRSLVRQRSFTLLQAQQQPFRLSVFHRFVHTTRQQSFSAPSPTSRVQALISDRNVVIEMPSAAAISTEPFPLNGLLPKESTEALSFLKKYPTYDGRNVRVAILDTGVDPAALGLSHRGKVVDIIDCTGSGDVPLQKIEPATSSSANKDVTEFTSPFTGRKILVSSKWNNPTAQWKIGYVAAYDLFPKELSKRRKDERMNAFNVSQQALLCQVENELYQFEQAKDDKDQEEAKKLKKEELKARVQALKDLASSYTDQGPLIEAIVFHDGQHWRAVVGGAEGDSHNSAKGLPQQLLKPLSDNVLDLSTHKPMTNYRVEQHWETFGNQDLLTYSVNIEDNGNVLSLVTLSGSHGTHVAGIVAARHDEQPELNGVAPGCEIVSLKIGDTRLGSMETGQALLRAAQALIETKCDIANMSYGESGAFGAENKGALAKALRDIVIRKRDILFVSSAGNSGPALTTVGQPGGTTSGVLSVGAHVTAGAMQRAEYPLVERGVPDSVTTWCSRGPCADGDRGVSIYAPGAAVTSIPKYCLQSSAMYNGTSMSSPNACGSIALLLTGMKDQGIPITPARVFKAIQHTGKDIGDPLSVPFIRVDAAWDYLVQNKDRVDLDAEFKVAVTLPGKPLGKLDRRGIYLREKNETQSVQQFNITVQPAFKEEETEKSFNLELRCALTATQSWVKTPEFLVLGGNGRTFEVRVDPTDLQPGLHHAFIEAYDTDKPGFKLFDIPVTIAKPQVYPSPTVRFSQLRFESGKIDRKFIHVPQGATWVSLTVRSANHSARGTSARLWLHCLQLEPLGRMSDVENAFVLALQENEPVTKTFAVRGGMTMEVCLAQFFTSKAAFDLDLELEFHGITTSLVPMSGREELTLIGGQGHAKLECMSNIRIETFSPTIEFSTKRSFLRPTDSVIRPLTTARDLQPCGKQLFELVATYTVSVKEDSSKVALSFPALGNHLYDSSVYLLWQLFDVRKKVIQFRDVYSEQTTLGKGDYTLKAQFLHENPKALESLKNATLMVDQQLSQTKTKALQPFVDHVDLHDAPKSTFPANGVKLHPGERVVLTLDLNLEGDALPKEAQPGDILVGSFKFASAEKTQLRYLVPPAPKKAEEDSSSTTKNEDEIPELLTATAKKIKEKKEKLEFMDKLIKEYPNYLGLQVAKLEALHIEAKESQKSILETAEKILSSVNPTDVKLWIATKRPDVSELTEEEKKTDEKIKTQKEALLLALNRKAQVLMQQLEDDSTVKKDSSEFNKVWTSYRSFFAPDSKDKDYVMLYIRWSMIHGRFGLALIGVDKLAKELGPGTTQNLTQIQQLASLRSKLVAPGSGLGWNLWYATLDRVEKINNPKYFAPF